MTKKTFVVILGISVSVWYVSRYIVALFDILILNKFNLTFSGSSCLPTGYPLFYCADNTLSLALIGSINILILFVVIWGVWKLLQTASKKKK